MRLIAQTHNLKRRLFKDIRDNIRKLFCKLFRNLIVRNIIQIFRLIKFLRQTIRQSCFISIRSNLLRLSAGHICNDLFKVCIHGRYRFCHLRKSSRLRLNCLRNRRFGLCGLSSRERLYCGRRNICIFSVNSHFTVCRVVDRNRSIRHSSLFGNGFGRRFRNRCRCRCRIRFNRSIVAPDKSDSRAFAENLRRAALKALRQHNLFQINAPDERALSEEAERTGEYNASESAAFNKGFRLNRKQSFRTNDLFQIVKM